MLNESQALEVRDHYSGKQKRRSYVFACKNTECRQTFCVEKSAFKLVTGYCRTCARRRRPFRQTYNILRKSAIRRGIEFDISYDELLFLTQIGTCYYCGETKIQWNPFPAKSAPRTNLDRKDNTKGYTFENVVVCCKECNMMKRDWFTSDEFKAISILLRKWRAGDQRDREELMYALSSWGINISVLI